MPNKEQVLGAFKECLCYDHRNCSECYQQGPGLGMVCRNNVCIAVAEILQEQQKKIDRLELENGEYKFAFMSMPTWLNSKMVEVIRCKDCEHSVPSSDGFVLCTAPFARSYPQDFKPVDWFCAGGKKREDNTSDMKYRDIYRKAAMVIGEENIDDYRPADTPNSIIIWLKNGDTMTYHVKDGGDADG